MRCVLLASFIALAISLPGHAENAEVQSQILSELDDINNRMALASKIKRHGTTIDWQEHSQKSLQDIYDRILLSHKLAQMGETVDWRDYGYDSLWDVYSRVWNADYLARRYRVHVNWREHSRTELYDFKERNRYAQMLQVNYGNSIDWSEFSLDELREAKRKMIVATNLRRREGREVDWRALDLQPSSLQGVDAEFAELLHRLANYTRSSVARVKQLAERTREILLEYGIDESPQQLTEAVWEIHEDLRFMDVQTALASYSAYRIEGKPQDEAIKLVINDHRRDASDLPRFEPAESMIIVTDNVGVFQWRFNCERVFTPAGKPNNYEVVGTVTNLAKTEYELPELGELMLFVDQYGREYSPITSNGKSVILRPAVPYAFEFHYEVAVDSIPQALKIRNLDDIKDQFDSDEFKVVPWPSN